MNTNNATLTLGSAPESSDRRQSGFLLAMLFVTLATSSIVFIEPAPYDLLLLTMLGGLLIMGLRFPREIKLPAILLGMFALGNVIAAAVSAEPLETLRSLAIRVYMPLAWCLFVSLIAAGPERVLRTIWLGYRIAAIIAVLWGILEYFGYINYGDWQPGLRAKGPFKDANVFAPFLIPVAVHALCRIAAAETWAMKGWNTGIFVFLSFGILLSFSRGAWMNFLLASALFSTFALASLPSHRARLHWLLVNALLVFAAVAMLAGAATSSSVADRLAQRAVIAQKYDLARGGRFYTQQLAIQKIATTPQGVGPGRSDEELGLEPHNLFLHVFVEGGWLAGGGFLLFLSLSFYRSLPLFRWRSPLRDEFFVVFSCLFGVLVQSMFIDSTHWRHSWLLLAMLWGLIIFRQRSHYSA